MIENHTDGLFSVVETEELMASNEYSNLNILECGKCRGRHFIVARGEYVTYVQCVSCGAKDQVHVG